VRGWSGLIIVCGGCDCSVPDVFIELSASHDHRCHRRVPHHFPK